MKYCNQSNKTYLVDGLLVVDVELPVGVDVDADLADVGVDEVCRVPLPEVVQELVHADLGQQDEVAHANLLAVEHRGAGIEGALPGKN